ncbi:MAG: hypothetical protein APF84_13895 [Gracilibacter sp. BRH_c7a]|nr:MAG: hypothetical protein APF84_13895 [Gracilibacter sp. BRH_c7a]
MFFHHTPSGDAEIVSFELGGQPFSAISAGSYFKFNTVYLPDGGVPPPEKWTEEQERARVGQGMNQLQRI